MDVVNLVVCPWMSPACLQVCGIQEVSLDVANVSKCLAKAPASLHVSPAESRRYHWMSRTLWYVCGCLHQVSRCLQQNPGGVIGCRKPRVMSLDVSSSSPGVSSGIQEVSLDIANIDICLAKAPASLQLQQNPGGIIGCCKAHGMSLDISSSSRGVSRRIQEVSLEVTNLMVHPWMSPAGLQLPPAESRRYHWM